MTGEAFPKAEIACPFAAGNSSLMGAIRIAYYRGLHPALASDHTDQIGCMIAAGLSSLEGHEI